MLTKNLNTTDLMIEENSFPRGLGEGRDERDDEFAFFDRLTEHARANYAVHHGRIDDEANGPNLMRELETLGYAPEAVKLAHLVPLIHVAWAEGRVTRRERTLICQAAQKRGIEPGSAEFARLEGWLDFRPSDEFFERNLRLVRALLHALPSEEREEAQHDLVALCAHVAEVSGGEPGFAAGGQRICDEEVEIVKLIAAELNRAEQEGELAHINLADATGITDWRTLDGLIALGFTGETARLLPLVPLVHVAWAEGGVSDRERQFVLIAARMRGIAPQDEANARLTSWLDTRPSEEFFHGALDALKQMFHFFPPDVRELNEWDLLANCEHVAVASSETADGGHTSNISEGERRLLDAITDRMQGTEATAQR